EYQGKGIGTALLKEGIKNLEGAKEIFINVEKDNQIGTTFYKAIGLEVVSEFDDNFDGHILKTVRMVLKL
ncbi:GNAT family N-acetyltransferase, partial [Peribacillus butanolivorans]|uniref:GNAT family N-acetyltransferase n=1 Tax=Peribacillus butanolivorans TaxID=421767 RepID=UPI00207CB0F4